VLVTGLEPARA